MLVKSCCGGITRPVVTREGQNMRSLRIPVLTLFVALAVVAGACGGPTTGPGASGGPGGTAAAAAKYGGTITFGLENDVSNLDPMLSGLFVDRNIHYMMYDSLVRVNTKGDIIPWLAEKWTTSSDGKTITFNLRQGVKYHDGTAFDAASVKWNIERYKNTKGSSRTGDLGAVATVDVVDTYTVKFNLSAAFAPLLAALVDRAGMMVSQKVADAMGADFTLKPFKAGTGPFILTEAVKTEHSTLERNPDWWGKDDWGNRRPVPPARCAEHPNLQAWAKADPEGAKKLIAEVGKPLKFELLVSSGDAGLLQLAQLIQAELKKADIEAELKTQLFNDIVTLQQSHKHLGMTLIGWSGRLDPDGNTYDFVVTGKTNNDSSYSNAKVDELMNQQRAESDPAKRNALLTQAQQIYVVDDPARVWFQFGASPIVTAKNVTGMVSYADRIPRFETAQLSK